MSMIERKVVGYQYTEDGKDFDVTTDYLNYKVYLGPPRDDGDITAIKAFGVAIGKAVRDLRKDVK